jgi:creatinine amidohydrolase
MGHACEWETSMMLRIDARRVGDHESLPPVDQSPPFQPGFRAWTTLERSPSGYIGRPDAASADKGERLLRRFADGAVDFLDRVARWDGRSWAE